MKRFSSITTTQLARICGVSQGTVDRALHGRPGINAKTRERILAAAREYAYLPHPDRPHVPGRSMLIGAVLFDLYNPFFSKLAMSLVKKAKATGYAVNFQFSEKNMEEEKAALDYFHYIGVDGIVLFSAGSDDEAYANYLHSLPCPVAAAGNRLFDLTYIGIDDKQAMYDLACQLLAEAGQGEILYFAPCLKHSLHRQNAQRLRLEGFRRAVEERGRSYRIALSEEELSAGAAGTICSTDYYAARALRRLGAGYEGILAGFDHVSRFKLEDRPVWTVAYSTDRIAEECMNYFWRRTYHPTIEHTVLFPSEGTG